MRIAFIDHSFHQRTHSSDFVVKMLEEIGEVSRFFDEQWRGGGSAWMTGFNEADFDIIVLHQVSEVFRALSGRHGNVIIIPMYDQMRRPSGIAWEKKFASVKCVSFCLKLHHEIEARGGESRYFKYFPDPSEHEVVSDFSEVRPLFWYRREDVAKRVLELLARADVDRLALHYAPDPDEPPLTLSELPPKISKLDITRWFEGAEAFRAALVRNNVFFAPRRFEGIGLSFLEAMASGLCVVAPNAATMNEYIADGTNGLLYPFDRPSTIELSRIREIGARARETVERGFADWQCSKPDLIDYIVTPKKQLASDRLHGFSPTARKIRGDTKRSVRVSVVTVCLNAAADLEKTIESVLGQDGVSVDYVILDGGSKDGSIEIIQKHAERLAYWHSEPDDGVYHAMNAAIDRCTGDWVLFMNAGDTFLAPDSLSRMFKHAPEDGDVVYGHHLYVDKGAEHYHPAADFETTWDGLQNGDLSFDWLSGIPGHQATAIRRSLLAQLRFDTSYRIAADHDVMFRARRGGAKFFNCDELLSVYVGGGMSAKNYALCRAEWRRIARTYGDSAAADRFYDSVDKAAAGNRRANPARIIRDWASKLAAKSRAPVGA